METTMETETKEAIFDHFRILIVTFWTVKSEIRGLTNDHLKV